MSETKPLNLTALAVTSGQLDIEVKNTSGATLGDQLWIEIQFPVALVDPRLRTAAIEARTNDSPKNMASLAGIVTAGDGMSVWAFNNPNDDLVAVRLYNYRDQNTGKALATPVKIEAGAAFTLRVPLSPQGSSAQVTIPYTCTRGSDKTSGSFTVTPADAGEWTPKVSFTIDQPNSTMLEPASMVKISWTIADGVSATLRGPLPGGHSQFRLSSDPEAPYKIAGGSLEIYAVGQATYILDVEVKRPRRQPNMQVVRTLLLDTKNVDQYASLRVRPKRVLPNGQIKIDWAVWGIKKATLSIGEHKSLALRLTEQDLSRTYQGTGTWSEKAPSTKETVYLSLDDSKLDDKTADIVVATWQKNDKPQYAGTPLGMAVAAPKDPDKVKDLPMALLTSDGLYVARIGVDDNGSYQPKFVKTSTDAPKAWLALTAFEQGFVVLKQTEPRPSMRGLQLARYDSLGKPQGPPVDLPEYVEIVLRHPGAVFDLAAFGKRVYVAIEVYLPGGSLRQALSVRFEPDAHEQSEPVLEQLRGYRLLNFANALYAVNRNSGHMYRFDPPDDEDRDLELPRKAKRAAGHTQSLLRQGLLVPVGDVLVVLGADDASPFRSSSLFGMTNVLDFFLQIAPPRKDADETPQDLVYNPKKDEWTACGQGLKIHTGAVAAYRGGGSPRLWVLQPDGEMHTLMKTEANLFAPDYITEFPYEVLPPALNAERKFKITNGSGMHFVSMENASMYSGLERFSSTGIAEITPLPLTLARNASETFKIEYHKTDPAPIKLRFMVQTTTSRAGYFVEVTFSGPDLSSVTSVFKRVAEDKAGVVSIDQVPDSLVQHPANLPITIPPPKRLTERPKLVICNATSYDLMRGMPQLPMSQNWETRIAYDTPAFTIFPRNGEDYRRAGELHVDLNFALPHGIEVLPRSMGQSKLVRISTDEAQGLGIRFLKMLKPGDPSVEVRYQGGKTTISADSDGPVYVCQIGYKVDYQLKKELAAVYVGDPASKGDIYLPVADPANVSSKEVWKLNPDTLDLVSRSPIFPGGGVFSLPNSIGVYRPEDTRERVFAMLSDAFIHDLDNSLNRFQENGKEVKRDYSDYTMITNLKSTSMGDIFVLGIKKQGNQLSPPNIKSHYWLSSEDIRRPARKIQLCLDDLPDTRGQKRAWEIPAWVSPSTVSPLAISLGNFRAAIGIEGGVMVIDLRNKVTIRDVQREKIEIIALDATGREEAVVFENTTSQLYLYCAHSQPNGKGLRISRINTKTLDEVKDKLTISIDPGEGDYEMTTNTRSMLPTFELFKRPRAISMVITPDNKSLFVSHGRTITQIDAKTMKVLRRLTVELPCRLFHVIQTEPAWMVYAIGATYRGNGSNVEEYETHLYKLEVLKDE